MENRHNYFLGHSCAGCQALDDNIGKTIYNIQNAFVERYKIKWMFNIASVNKLIPIAMRCHACGVKFFFVNSSLYICVSFSFVERHMVFHIKIICSLLIIKLFFSFLWKKNHWMKRKSFSKEECLFAWGKSNLIKIQTKIFWLIRVIVVWNVYKVHYFHLNEQRHTCLKQKIYLTCTNYTWERFICMNWNEKWMNDNQNELENWNNDDD